MLYSVICIVLYFYVETTKLPCSKKETHEIFNPLYIGREGFFIQTFRHTTIPESCTAPYTAALLGSFLAQFGLVRCQ